MNKKKAILITLFLLVVGGLYLYVYQDSFKRPVIHVSHTIRAGNPRRRGTAAPGHLVPIFSLNGEYKLTHLRVVAVDDLKTNKYPHALWEMAGDPVSAPIRAFMYSVPVRGMKMEIPGTAADSLLTNVNYRLFVEAGRVKGEHDFMIPGQPEPPAQ